ncbi:MAG: peroxide stress protein YaaA [Aquificaceae bacterium]|nr:peroxide stress protein YaaA [Aquificaceae bacterium]
MFLFLLPYSKKQHAINYRDCNEDRFYLKEFEPFSRLLERNFLQNSNLAPLYRRFADTFWESLEFWVLPPRVKEYIKEHSWVLSPLYGLLKPTACVPYVPLSWKEEHGGKILLEFWKEHIRNLSKRMLEGKRVIPLIPEEHFSLFDFSHAEKVIKFEYYRKNEKVKNPSKHRAYTLRYITEKELSLPDFQRINFYDYKVEKVEEKGRVVLVKLRSEGKYEI